MAYHKYDTSKITKHLLQVLQTFYKYFTLILVRGQCLRVTDKSYCEIHLVIVNIK